MCDARCGEGSKQRRSGQNRGSQNDATEADGTEGGFDPRRSHLADSLWVRRHRRITIMAKNVSCPSSRISANGPGSWATGGALEEARVSRHEDVRQTPAASRRGDRSRPRRRSQGPLTLTPTDSLPPAAGRGFSFTLTRSTTMVLSTRPHPEFYGDVAEYPDEPDPDRVCGVRVPHRGERPPPHGPRPRVADPPARRGGGAARGPRKNGATKRPRSTRSIRARSRSELSCTTAHRFLTFSFTLTRP